MHINIAFCNIIQNNVSIAVALFGTSRALKTVTCILSFRHVFILIREKGTNIKLCNPLKLLSGITLLLGNALLGNTSIKYYVCN